jgi:arylsulfatase A-like enzyme/cytochrome c-type biogenesis protein CcmH/NrfG
MMFGKDKTIARVLPAFLCMLIGCGGGARDAGSGGQAASASTAAVATKIDAVVLITIDTLRADRVGAYGWRAARTPAIDALAGRGVRAERAYATAPITLTSHASLLTGVYPSRHGARHNGMRVKANVPTLAEMLRAKGFATGAFIAAFPLDRRFGLDRGFDAYGDTLPRGADGRPRNERPGQSVVDEALAWVAKTNPPGGTPNAFGANASSGPATASGVGASSAPTNTSGAGANTPGRQTSATGSAVTPGAAGAVNARTTGDGGKPLFLWVHLFEPHAPYEADASMGAGGHSTVGRSISDRYDDEVARADRQVARIVDAFAPRRASTLFIVAADHGEAFGEHGEVGHSLFVYDSTLRVPLILAGPGIDSAGGDRPYVDQRPVSLVDIVPTVLQLVGLPPVEADGISLLPLSAEQRGRELYAESYAPLLDFGWSPLRAMRSGRNKYIAAPKPELYDITDDPSESRNLAAASDRADTIKLMAARVDRISPADLVIPPADTNTQNDAGRATAIPDGTAKGASGASGGDTSAVAGSAAATNISRTNAAAANAAKTTTTGSNAAGSNAPGANAGGANAGATNASRRSAGADREALARLQSLGYIGAQASIAKADATGAITISAKDRPDPKDRVELAARIGQVTSGELHGLPLRAALERIVRDDPKNGQMRMRLAFALQESGECAAAVPHFEAAIAAAVPSADPHLGLAECLAATGRADAARRALIAADRIEPGNPIVSANLGLMALDAGRVDEAIDRLKSALTRVPDLHEARFALIRAYARNGSQEAAAREAKELLARLPADAPQRAEVERLLAAVQ